jgi:hypothetical protein
MNELTDLELGWIVGMIEGEGTFGTRTNRLGSKYATIEASSTDEEVIIRLQSILGGRVNGPYPNGKGCKHYWRWVLAKQAAVFELAEIIMPLLSERRRHRLQQRLQHAASGTRIEGSKNGVQIT